MMKHMRVLFAAFLVTALAAAGTAAEREFKDTGKYLMWEIRSETSTAFILGSLHLTDDSIYPLDDSIMQAYEESDALVLELISPRARCRLHLLRRCGPGCST